MEDPRFRVRHQVDKVDGIKVRGDHRDKDGSQLSSLPRGQETQERRSSGPVRDAQHEKTRKHDF